MEPPTMKLTTSQPGPHSTKLHQLDRSKPHTFINPTKCINEGHDVPRFLVSKGYRDIGIFVLQLNRSLCPRKKAGAAASGAAQTFTLEAPRNDSPSVKRLQELLEKINAIVEEAPPDPGPRRFGNVSFRTWYRLVEERTASLLEEAISSEVLKFGASGTESEQQGQNDDDGNDQTSTATALDELTSYLLGSFGSAQRLDFGTGHELSFLAFLGSLWQLGGFERGALDGEVERSIVLGVIQPYLKVVRKLILTYNLEPAGSHGVWGLDDHSFIPYIFGSAQLTRPISEDEAMPQEGSVLRAPKPADILKPTTVEVQRELNMYFSAVGFINDVKKGPFWEHSPILFDISGIKDGWGKINKGMIKMFNAEVLSKFPVVQHFPFGSLFSWDQDPDATAPAQTVHMTNQPTTAGPATGMPPPPPAGGGTAAPWAQATRMPGPAGPGIPYSRVPGTTASENSGMPGPTVRPPPPMGQGRGPSGTAGAQITVTKAPWARDQ